VSAVLCQVNERGQGLIEYALILVLVAVVVIAVLLILGPVIGNVFTRLNSQLTDL
jgi:pilus assembly protein Flp/PilA